MRANLAPAIIYGSAFGLTWGFSSLLLNLFPYPYFVVSTFVFYLAIMVLFQLNLCALLGSVKLSLSVQKSRMQMFGTIPIAFFD